MKKSCKKILTGVFILLFVFLFKLPNAHAASCRIGVSAPASIVVGKSFNVTVTVSGGASIGSWEYTLSYDSSKVRLNSGSLHVVDYGNGSKKSASYSYTFTALKSGTATFKPVNASVLDYTSTNECLSSTGSASVTMKTQAEIEASYSRNNNLSSLSVEGAELTPAFNKNVTEYSATLPVDTTKAKILATKEDNTASITGAGEIDVVDGLNKIEITVTAQHGEKKTYVINLTVEELDPVIVKINGKNYTLVRKSGQVENVPVGFVETKITVENQEVAAYKSEIAKLTLVALKDGDGNISLFVYNASKKTYSKFIEAKSFESNLLILEYDGKDIPTDFVKTSFKYNNETINGFKLSNGNDSNYYLIYAKNLETGNENFYLYDKKENTFQRYFSEITKIKDDKINLMKYIIIGLSVSLALILLILIIVFLKKIFTPKDKKIAKYSAKINNLSKDKKNDFDTVNEDEIAIKKVEEDEYFVPKKNKKQRKKELEEARKKLEETKPSFRRVSLEEDE